MDGDIRAICRQPGGRGVHVPHHEREMAEAQRGGDVADIFWQVVDVLFLISRAIGFSSNFEVRTHRPQSVPFEWPRIQCRCPEVNSQLQPLRPTSSRDPTGLSSGERNSY